MHIRFYLATLEFVNRERAALGLVPLERRPVGTPRHANLCVIARAIPGSTVSDRLTIKATRRTVCLPAEVRQVLVEFDRQTAHDPVDFVDGGIDDEKGCLVSI